MKKTMITTAAILLMTTAALAAAPTGNWFDLDNCAMCRNLTADEELFSNMQWENKLFANGLLEITKVPAHFEDRFQELSAKMQATGQKLMAGEQLPMCGMCQSYGTLMMAGATMDQITSGESHMTIISSQDPKIVAMIRTHGQTTIDEYAKWMTSGEKSHKGHDHKH
jgi:hypothetical protein